MAVVQGIKERVHLPLYDSVSVKREEQLQDDQRSSTLKFFVDVQGKTKLETNLQSASQLSHYNTYEARAMRVVVSDLPPVFPEDPTAEDTDFDVVDDSEDENPFLYNNHQNKVGVVGTDGNVIKDISDDGFSKDGAVPIKADLEVGLNRIVELLQEARDSEDGFTSLSPTDEEVTLLADETELDRKSVV